MKNREIAEIFREIADVLELKEENPFKIRAYRRASQIIRDLSMDIEKVCREGKLKEIPGIGEGIAKKIKEYLETGRVRILKEITKGVPEELIGLMAIPSLGPKSLALIHKELKVKNLKSLQRVLINGKVAKIKGFGPLPVDVSFDELQKRLVAARDALSQQRMRWLINRERDLLESGNVFGESVNQDEFHKIKFEALIGNMRRTGSSI